MAPLYAGVVLRDGYLYASYYTSNIDRDYPWIVGMLVRSDIRIAKIGLESLAHGEPPGDFTGVQGANAHEQQQS